jgi:hypothetical protein
LLAGALAGHMGAQNTILVSGLACSCATAVFLYALPGLERATNSSEPS